MGDMGSHTIPKTEKKTLNEKKKINPLGEYY